MDLFGVFMFLGGLGLFLYGMKIMSDGLELAAGDRLRLVLEKTTKNRFAGIGVGTGVTALIQSSSATTVMLVGFVNAGLMTLSQATGVIMGANIGTTITGQMIAFKLDNYAPVVLFIGVVLYLFVKNRSVKRISLIIMGFGILFMGMGIMSKSIAPLKDSETFRAFLISFDNPLIAILVGTVFTAIMQSSSAAIGVMEAFAMQGLLTLDTAVYIVLGMNIGTCITAVLASFAASRDSKRTALIHVLFNVMGVVIFGSAVALIPGIVTIVENWSPGDYPRQIANFHTFFNIATTIILVPFAGTLVYIVKKLIPKQKSEERVERRLMYLDKHITITPAIAVTQAHREVCRMGRLAYDNYLNSIQAFFNQDLKLASEVLEVERTINFLNHEITGCLVRLRGLDLPDKDIENLSLMFSVVSDFERIGDHAENIAEYAQLLDSQHLDFSEVALSEIRTLADSSAQTVLLSLETYENREIHNISAIRELEDRTDELRDIAIEGHLQRLMTDACNPRTGVVFTDMVSDLERCADHATNIAYSLLGEPSLWDDEPDTLPDGVKF